jgi:hypothetical protein
MVYEYGFNVETSTDSPFCHPSERDVLQPRQLIDPALKASKTPQVVVTSVRRASATLLGTLDLNGSTACRAWVSLA